MESIEIMVYSIGVEDIEPNHWVAWVFDLPGCYSKARDREEAIANAPLKIAEYFQWLTLHHYGTPQPTDQIEMKVVESFHSFISVGDYIVNAFFEDDRRPLRRGDLENALTLLEFSRGELLTLIRSIPKEWLDRPIPGEVQGSIRGILNHVAWAEWWYFDSLDMAFRRDEMPEDTMLMLEKVRTHTRIRLPEMIGNKVIAERIGERWSARKVIRRTLWHERAHTQQIIRYLGQ